MKDVDQQQYIDFQKKSVFLWKGTAISKIFVWAFIAYVPFGAAYYEDPLFAAKLSICVSTWWLLMELVYRIHFESNFSLMQPHLNRTLQETTGLTDLEFKLMPFFRWSLGISVRYLIYISIAYLFVVM